MEVSSESTSIPVEIAKTDNNNDKRSKKTANNKQSKRTFSRRRRCRIKKSSIHSDTSLLNNDNDAGCTASDNETTKTESRKSPRKRKRGSPKARSKNTPHTRSKNSKNSGNTTSPRSNKHRRKNSPKQRRKNSAASNEETFSRRRKKQKRQWKPYSKMTWQEKKELEQNDDLRAKALELREHKNTLPKDNNGRILRGINVKDFRPSAPRNTSQFIIANHDNFSATEFDGQPLDVTGTMGTMEPVGDIGEAMIDYSITVNENDKNDRDTLTEALSDEIHLNDKKKLNFSKLERENQKLREQVREMANQLEVLKQKLKAQSCILKE